MARPEDNMQMTPYYLQTADEAAMWSALDELGFIAYHEGIPCITVEHSIIGEWYECQGEECVKAEGWFFNPLLDTNPTWPAYVTTAQPTTPWRVWG